MTQDDRMETITDPAAIRATDEPDPFRRNPVRRTGPDDPWRFTRFVADDHECVIVRDEYDEPAPFGSCRTHRRALSSPVAPGCTTPAPVGAAVALDLDAAHVRTDPACTFHDGTTPKASRGKICPACMRLDLGALHETICDNFTGMAEVRQAADLLVAEVRRLTRWQSEALLVMVGLQGLGSALGMRLGESITGHAAAEAARALTARAEAAEADVRRLTEALAECERQFQAQVAARTAEAEAADRGGRVRTCEQEMCPFWSGDGCAGAVFDTERPKPGCDDCGRWHVREECPEAQR